MHILGIETSCDETSAAIYGDSGLLSNIVASQEIHKIYGGVVPELASRAHIQLINPIVKKALSTASLSFSQLNGIAVTYGPGLVGSILVGLNFAKGLAYALRIPWLGINHIEGHLLVNLLDPNFKTFPFISLIVSGGHTQLIYVKKIGDYKILGATKDDAAGEAYDKVAKMLNLGYPGGPIIDGLAKNGNTNYVDFPRAMLSDESFNFSFSGLKTAVLYYLKNISLEEQTEHQADIAASFQAALVDVLVTKTLKAAIEYNVTTIALGGGVACNSYLREQMKQKANEQNIKTFLPAFTLCTDNAAMIACVGFHKLKQHQHSPYSLSPNPALQLTPY